MCFIVLFTDKGPNTDWGTDSYVGRTVLWAFSLAPIYYYYSISGSESLYYTHYPEWIRCIVDRVPWSPAGVKQDVKDYRGDVSKGITFMV